MRNRIHIFGGGTVQYVRSHLALCAPAYGTTARKLQNQLQAMGCKDEQIVLHLTKMADHTSTMETNEDVVEALTPVLEDPNTSAIIFNIALCDFSGQIGDTPSGKYAARLQTRRGEQCMQLNPTPKLLRHLKELRPDVMVVGFKTTTNESLAVQVDRARRQIDETGVDLVWANDTGTRLNVLVPNNPRGEVQVGTREQLLTMLAERLGDLV